MKKCKSCKAEIPNDAKKCSHCGTDQRGFFLKHPIISSVLALILLFVIIGVASSGKGGTSASNSSSSGNNSSNTSSVSAGKVGQTVTDGDLGFTVESVDTASSVGSTYFAKTAQGEYYILTVKIENNGKDTKTFNASDFKVTDSQGRSYDYSQDGQTAMEESNGSTDFFLQQIQPSLSVTGKIVFDVPKTATGLKLNAQGDIFSNGVSIDLGK